LRLLVFFFDVKTDDVSGKIGAGSFQRCGNAAWVRLASFNPVAD